MTVPVGASADSNVVVRGWHAFRRWQRSRPFWGPLLMILAGVELFFSANLNLGGLKIHLGVEGFLSYLLPAVMLLSGILVWATPHLRVFYSVIGTVTAVYSMVGLNLGGFLCGMMLGILGGALTFAWTPVVPPAPPTSPAPAPPTSPAPALGTDDGDRITQELDTEPITEPIDMGTEHEQLQPVDGDPGDDPPGDARGRSHTSLCVCGTALVLAAVFAAVVQHSPGEALAAPCVGASAAAPAPAAANVPAEAPADAPAESPAEAPAAPAEPLAEVSATPTPTAGPPPGPTASPTPAPTSTPVPTPTAPCTDGGTGSPTPSPSSASPTPVPTAPPGQRIVAGVPGRLTAATMTLQGLVFEGVADLPTASGSVKVLTFSVSKATATNFVLATGTGGTLTTMVDRPVLNAHVRFDTTSFSGKLLGVPFTYTPQTPPQSALPSPSADITDVSMDLVFVSGDTFDAAGLVEALTA